MQALFSKMSERIIKILSPNGLFLQLLRKKGVSIGEGTMFFGHVDIDITRPSLIEIGKNCILTDGVRVLTHGLDWAVLKNIYGEVMGSSGKVTIEDNVFVGTDSIILKGVRIGANSIIGAGSLVAKDIPSNSVAFGNPCKVRMSIAEYYEKRKNEYVEEAKAYALELYRKTGRIPVQEDFWEEFPIFLKRDGKWGGLQLNVEAFYGKSGKSISRFLESKPIYDSFEAFLIASGIPQSKVNAP